MSITLLNFAKSFVNGRLEPYVFAESYIKFYRIERDLKQLDDSQLSAILSSIFCIADMYNPNQNKEDYEFDDKQLIEMVKTELDKLQNTNVWNDFEQSLAEFDPNFTNSFSKSTTWENQINSVFDNLEKTAIQDNKITVEKLPLQKREPINFTS